MADSSNTRLDAADWRHDLSPREIAALEVAYKHVEARCDAVVREPDRASESGVLRDHCIHLTREIIPEVLAAADAVERPAVADAKRLSAEDLAKVEQWCKRPRPDLLVRESLRDTFQALTAEVRASWAERPAVERLVAGLADVAETAGARLTLRGAVRRFLDVFDPADGFTSAEVLSAYNELRALVPDDYERTEGDGTMSAPSGIALPVTWRWLREGAVPPNRIRLEGHPTGRWAVSYNLNKHGEFALCVQNPRPYGPSWHSLGEAERAGWIADAVREKK